MPQFAANLSLMYPEHPFLDRFGAAADDGFRAVECLFPYEYPAAEVADRLARHRLTQALFNLPPGDWAAGERGMACLAGREDEFMRGVDTALAYALATGCKRLHALAGRLDASEPQAQARERYVRNLRQAAAHVAPHDITLLIEPINTRDMPGYLLNYQQQALDVIEDVGAPNLKLQFDLYHCQIMEGDIRKRLERCLPHIGHVQVAGVPHRHEPDTGELHFDWLMAELDALGYIGHVGCEYRPRATTAEGLGWFGKYRKLQG